jgi:hypothetical protein
MLVPQGALPNYTSPKQAGSKLKGYDNRMNIFIQKIFHSVLRLLLILAVEQ